RYLSCGMLPYCSIGTALGPDGDDRSQDQHEATHPHPENQRIDKHFERSCLGGFKTCHNDIKVFKGARAQSNFCGRLTLSKVQTLFRIEGGEIFPVTRYRKFRNKRLVSRLYRTCEIIILYGKGSNQSAFPQMETHILFYLVCRGTSNPYKDEHNPKMDNIPSVTPPIPT